MGFDLNLWPVKKCLIFRSVGLKWNIIFVDYFLNNWDLRFVIFINSFRFCLAFQSTEMAINPVRALFFDILLNVALVVAVIAKSIRITETTLFVPFHRRLS